MRRFYLALVGTLAVLIMSALPIRVAALGEVQANLACSDGTISDLVVDTDTLTGLKDAVEAMTLYPAGLTCTLSSTPLTTSLGANVAQASGGTDFVVGGGQRTFCNTNIAINGHAPTGMTTPAWGTVNQTIPDGAPGGCQGIFRTEVVCVVIKSPTDAFVGARITTSTGVFSDALYTEGKYLVWYFHEGNSADIFNPPIMWNSAPLDNDPSTSAATCTFAPITTTDTLVHGRILVKQHA